MAEPLKNFLSPPLMKTVCRQVHQIEPEFNAERFTESVFTPAWQNLTLKQRYRHISHAFKAALPGDFPHSAQVLAETSKGFSGFEYIFFPDFIEAFGCHPSYIDASLTALEIMTEHSSAEFAIRPFLERFPEQTWGQLQRWAQSPNEHHRRLASEGSRPRLPWARRLSVFSDPTQRLPILEQLKRDESPYVRKSVANHLNDLGKDHPDWLLSIAHDWLGQHPHTDWIVKHACRNLLKQSNPKALRLFGYRATPDIELEALTCSPTVSLGDTLAFAFTLQTRAQKLGRLRIEFAIDYVKANGKWSPKRFKLAEGEYPTNLRHFEKQLLFKPLTTRRHYPGTHRLSIIVNGEVKASATFDLKIPKRQKTKVSH